MDLLGHPRRTPDVRDPTDDRRSQVDARSMTLEVRTALKAGGRYLNHNEPVLRVRSGVKAGGVSTSPGFR